MVPHMCMQVPSSPSSLERLRKNGCMDADRFPTGSRVEVYWPGDEEWFAAAVLKTRTMSHNIDGAQTLCREIFCYYDLDLHMQWHSLHEDDVRTCSTTSPADESGIPDPFPTGVHVEVWCSRTRYFFVPEVRDSAA